MKGIRNAILVLNLGVMYHAVMTYMSGLVVAGKEDTSIFFWLSAYSIFATTAIFACVASVLRVRD